MYSTNDGNFSDDADEDMLTLYVSFQNLCHVQGLPVVHQGSAFSAWLRSEACTYFKSKLENLGLSSKDIITKLRTRYYKPERERMILKRCQSVSFRS